VTSTAATQTENCPKTSAGDTRKRLAARDQRTADTKVKLSFVSPSGFLRQRKLMFVQGFLKAKIRNYGCAEGNCPGYVLVEEKEQH